MKTLLNRAFALSAAIACVIPATAAAADRSSFLLGVLPDTQFYSRYSIPSSGELFIMNRWGSEPYIEQTKWLVANKDDRRGDGGDGAGRAALRSAAATPRA